MCKMVHWMGHLGLQKLIYVGERLLVVGGMVVSGEWVGSWYLLEGGSKNVLRTELDKW